jgi:hypothetical protein
LGAWLAGVLKVPHVPLDEVFWQPGWQKTPTDKFRATIKAAMDENRAGWIIDGHYNQANMIQQEATDIICEYQNPIG